MRLRELLRQRREGVAGRFAELVLATYPADSQSFLGRKEERFNNPVGAAIARETATLVGALLGEVGEADVTRALDTIVRIRAVQEFSPSRAVGVVLLLKQAVREAAHEEGPVPAQELAEVEAQVDALTLRGFDLYVACREQIYALRAREDRARVATLLRRAGAVDDDEVPPGGEAPDPERPR